MLPKIKIADLPSVYLLDKYNLPSCAAIYFVGDNSGQIIYIGRTVNLVARWRDHHRFNQFKRFNRKNALIISWLTCSSDLNTLSALENEFIKLYKPPLNWSKVVTPVKKITPVETALQHSLQRLAKLNTVIFGFDPIAREKPPTIYLEYPVYGRRGVSGSIRVALRNINKKASSLKWKEYYTEPKSRGKFGYWETEYNGIRIDLSPVEGLVNIMQDTTRRTIAGVEFIALSTLQIEAILETAPDIKKEYPGLESVEEDPIPMKFVDKFPASNGNNSVSEVEPWKELEPMAESEVKVMNRQFLHVDNVEVEVCTDDKGKYFVRHNVYW